MKNNDLDFIKDKFDSSGVNAPEEMDEAFVLEKLENVQQLKEVPRENKKKYWIPAGISAAAAIAVITATTIAASSVLGGMPGKINLKKTRVPGTASLVSFSTREDVIKAANKISTANEYYNNLSSSIGLKSDELEYGAINYEAADSFWSGSSLSGGSSPSDSSHNATYIQETGVDEADTVKTDGRYIYCVNSKQDYIDVLSAEGKNSKRLTQISVIRGEDYGCISDFYIYGSKLVVLSEGSIRIDSDKATHDEVGTDDFNYEYDYGFYDYKSITLIDVFDISDISHSKRLSGFSQSGSYCSSRMINGMLYVVSTDYYSDRNNLIPFTCDGAESTIDELDADCVFSVESPKDSNFLVVSSVNTDNSDFTTNTKAILGSADTVYCNTENLYVTANKYTPVFYNDLMAQNMTNLYTGSYAAIYDTQIVKVSLDRELDFKATTTVSGRIDNQYSLDEHEGNLRVATTSQDDEGKDINNLFVFDSELNEIGSVTGFAKNESIKAVRYIGSTAYVITYEETDPLFVIDVSNPSKPEIKGEVKISGFSTLLVPVDNNTLLGIGYHTQDEDDGIDMEIQEGLKLVVFDVTDKSNPKVLDEKIYEDCYSEVQNNPKALLVNFERGDYTIPYEYYNYSENFEEGKSGVINFRVENGKISVIDEYESSLFSYKYDYVSTSFEYSVVKRCVYVGNTVYLIGEKDNGEGFSTVIDSVDYK